MAFWTRNDHLIVDADGHPIDCPWCPCGPSGCDEIIEQQIARCEQDGAYYLHRTGFLYSTTDAALPVIASIFHWISWTFDNVRQIYVCMLNYLNCDCETDILATADFAAPPATPDLFGFGFIASEDACSGDCAAEIATLIAQAVVNGWTLHGEGVLVRKTSTDYSCYRFDLNKITVMICADTGSSFIYITCDCHRSDITGNNYPLYTHLEYAGCACLDIRELILTYPDVFGVDDISFGDNTVVDERSTLDAQAYYDDFIQTNEYCDYRNIYIIFDNDRIRSEYSSAKKTLFVFHPPQAYLHAWDFILGTYDINFVGHVKPFTNATDSEWPGVSWAGSSISYWNGSPGEYDIGEYWSKADAEAAVAASSISKVTLEVECRDWSTLSPVQLHAPQVVQGYVEYNDWNGMWTAYAPHYEEGIWYSVRYIVTNAGYHVMGIDGIQECFEIKGYGNLSQYYHGVAGNEDCGEPQDRIRCADVNNDMGGCMDAEWWQAIMEEAESSESSESSEE